MKNTTITLVVFFVLNGCFHLGNGLSAQDDLWAYAPSKIKIPLELQEKDLRPGAQIKLSLPTEMASMMMACPGGAPIEGFTMCADQGSAAPALDRNDWWNCCSPPGWLPSEAYEFNFPSIETFYPCVAGAPVEELILTVTIQSISFDPGSPYACCEQYFEGLYANLYDNCGGPCTVVGDGLTPGGVGDCAPSGDHIELNAGFPFTSITTCLDNIISTSDQLGVDIVPSFSYQDAAAAGCNCTQDLISQGFVSVEYDLQVEFKFCEADLPNNCYPAEFMQVGPLCESDPSVTLPTTSVNGVEGTWDPATINPSGLGGTTVTATFTPDAGQCVGGTAVMEIEINESTTPEFTQIGPVCENDPPVSLPTTSDNGISGTWDVGPTFNPSGQGGNTVTITFTPDFGECASTATMMIEVQTEGTPIFNQIGPLCETDPPVNLPSTSNNGVSGTWDVGPTFNPSGQGGMSVTINFTPDPDECADATSMVIEVEEELLPSFNQIGPLCETDPPVNLPATSNNGVTGTWDVGTTFNPSGQGGTSVTINFTPNASECASGTSMTIEIEEEVTPEFTQIDPVCESDPPIALPATSNNGVSGTWDVGPTFNPAGQGGMSVTITFTPNATECAVTQTMTIEVEEEIMPTFDPIGPLCENEPPVALPSISNNGVSGTWDVGPFFNPAGQGGMSVNLVFTPDFGVCAAVFQMTIEVTELGLPEFVQIGPLCESEDPVPLPSVSVNGISGTWDVGPFFDPTGLGGGFVTITFMPDPSECATQTEMDIFVNEEVMPTFFPIGPFCQDDAPFVLPNSSIEGVEGTWSVGPVFDPSGNTGTTNITFNPNMGECASSSVEAVTVNGLPTYSVEEVACNPGNTDYFVEIQTSADQVASTAGTVTNNSPGSFTINGIPDGVGVTITVTNSVTGCDDMFNVTAPNCDCPNIPPPTGMNVEACANDTTAFLEAFVAVGLTVDWFDAASGGTLLLSNSTTYTPPAPGTYYAEAVDSLTDCRSTTRRALSLILIELDTTLDTLYTCDTLLVGLDTTIYATATCDSVVITETLFGPAVDTLLLATTCDTNLLGMDTVILTTSTGCDSLVITQTTFSAADTTLVPMTTCDPLLVGVDTTIYNTGACDSVVITQTTLSPSDETNLTATSCDPNDVGVDTIIFQNQFGCDSLVITQTNFSAADTTFVPATTCDPLLVGVDTTIYNTSTCDSVVITQTTLSPSDETNLTATSCDPNEVSVDTVIFQNQFGCDSLVITQTNLSAADTTFVPATTCDPLLVGVDTTIYNTSTCDSVVITQTTLTPSDETNLTATTCDLNEVGVDTVVFQNQFGCDSLVITETNFLAADTTFIPLTTCDPSEVGIDTVFFATAACDSVVITETTLIPPSETNLTAFSCDPNLTGVDTTFLVNVGGCDSLVITQTLLSDADTVLVPATTCDPMLVGMDTTVYQTSTCDSVVITTTTLLPPSQTNLMASSCDPMQVGLDTVVLQNQFGCDSLVITETILDPSSEISLMASTCDAAQVGLDTLILQNQFGCDSLVITEYVLEQISETSLTATTCDAAQVGLDTVVLQTQNGCDSLVITEYVLDIIDPTFLSATSCDPTEVGVDTVIFQTATCDSLVITTTTLVFPSESVASITTCDLDEVGSDTLVLVNAAGCDSLVITNLVFEPSISAAAAVPNDPACGGTFGSIEVTDVVGGETPYLYSIDGGATFLTDPLLVNLLPGVYEIIIQDANGCEYVLDAELSSSQVPELYFDPAVLNLSLGETVNLVPITTSVIDSLQSIVWSPTDSLSCADCFTTDAMPFQTTEYTLTIMDENGCEATATILLQVADEQRVYTPNGFSPNGDGINDVFTIYADEGYVKSVLSLKIFDRWGDNVFEGYDFPPNVEANGWDGKRNGKIVEQGVHVFLAELELVNGRTLQVAGEITVIR